MDVCRCAQRIDDQAEQRVHNDEHQNKRGEVDAPFCAGPESALLAMMRVRAIPTIHDLYSFVHTILQLRSVLYAP